MSSSVSLRIAAIFGAGNIEDLQASRNQRRVSFNSLRQPLVWERNLSAIRRLRPRHGFRMVKFHSEEPDPQDDSQLSCLAARQSIV